MKACFANFDFCRRYTSRELREASAEALAVNSRDIAEASVSSAVIEFLSKPLIFETP